MSVTVADVLLHVRDAHPAFGKRNTPDGPVLRFLTRYQQEILARLAQIKKNAVQSLFELEIPAEADFADGDYLPEHILVHGGDVVFTDTARKKEPLDLVSFAQRLEDRRWGAFIQGRNIKLLGLFSDWSAVERIDVFYFPYGEDLTGRTSEFDLPGSPLTMLVAAAAHFIGSRPAPEGAPPVDVVELGAEKLKAQEEWFDAVTGRRYATVGTVREVW